MHDQQQRRRPQLRLELRKSQGLNIVKTVLRLLLETLSRLVSLLIVSRRSKITQLAPAPSRLENDDPDQTTTTTTTTIQILAKPASVLAQAIRARELTSEQVVGAFVERCKRVNPTINAVAVGHYEAALKRAREIDALLADPESSNASGAHTALLKSPLLGVPLTVKETVALEGAPYTAGLRSRRTHTASYSNPGVERLVRVGGLIPLASTNTPCMNMWYDSHNYLYGRTLNPYDLARTPGGSSGGEGALLAAAGSCLGVGSDLAGSIRLPANFCGVFGHKPTPRAISCRGLFPTGDCEDLAAVGPMARFACDLRPALELMLTNEEARTKMRLAEPVDLRQVKLFYCLDLGDSLVSQCDREVREAILKAVEHLRVSHRMEVQEVRLEEFKYGMLLWKAEVAGKLFYYPEHAEGLVRYSPWWQLAKALVGLNELPLGAILAAALDKLPPYAGSRKNLKLREKAVQLRTRFNDLVGTQGVLVMPTFSQVAPQHALTYLKIPNIAYTGLVNVLHAPVTQCPVGLSSSSGLPIGLQLVAGAHQDRLTLAVACELDKALGGWRPAA